jgi:AhpD family alkylhydroperoxidase
MNEPVYPAWTPEIARQRREAAPASHEAFQNFSRQVFAAGALDVRTKQIIAVAVAHVTQCPYCIAAHTELALKAGATREQIMEAVWVAAEMRAGGAYAHAAIAMHTIHEAQAPKHP